MIKRVLRVVVPLVIVASATTVAGATVHTKSNDTKALQQVVGSLKAARTTGDPLDGTEIVSATVTHFGYLAVGITAGHISIWTSKDAHSFKRVPDDQLGGVLPVPADAIPIIPIAADGKGAVIVDEYDALVTSDGRKFEHLSTAQSGLSFGEHGTIAALHSSSAPPVAVAVSGSRAVAVGTSCWCSSQGGGYPFGVPTTWVSLDRTHWTGTPLRGANTPAGGVHAVIAVGGQFVMAGNDSTNPKNNLTGDVAGIWRSRDGKTWTAVGGLSTAVPGGNIVSLASKGNTVVGVGTVTAPPSASSLPLTGSGLATVWRSTDSGATWARVTKGSRVFGTSSVMQQVVATADGFIAMGTVYGQVNKDTIWVSRDGATWKVAAGFNGSGGLPRFLLANGHGLIAFFSYSAADVPPGNTYVHIGGKLPK